MTSVPQPPKVAEPRFDDWLFRFWKSVNVTASSTGEINAGAIDHAYLGNLNSAGYYHLSQNQANQLTGGGTTSLHTHAGINQFITSVAATTTVRINVANGAMTSDVIPSGISHATLASLNTTTYSHLTSTEKTDLLAGTYLTIDHTGVSLANERALALGTGLSYTDGGAGGSYTIAQVAFVGDSGAGGYIGAVPAPAIGDGTGTYRSYLCGDGLWRNPATSGDVSHTNINDIQGGIATGVFETTAFELTAFQTGLTQYYHITKSEFEDIQRNESVLTTAIDATLDDTAATCVVTASAKVITLPTAIPSRISKVWTVIQNCVGYVDIYADATDSFVLPGGTDNIRLDQIGSSVSLKCISSSEWVIV